MSYDHDEEVYGNMALKEIKKLFGYWLSKFNQWVAPSDEESDSIDVERSTITSSVQDLRQYYWNNPFGDGANYDIPDSGAIPSPRWSEFFKSQAKHLGFLVKALERRKNAYVSYAF